MGMTPAGDDVGRGRAAIIVRQRGTGWWRRPVAGCTQGRRAVDSALAVNRDLRAPGRHPRMNSTTDSPQAGDAPLIQIRGLTFRRGARAIFDSVDLDIPR